MEEDLLMNKCTLLLSSYDGGEDCWEGFFKALSIQWPEMDMEVVLNTETKDYAYPEYKIRTLKPCVDRSMTWAERIIFTLDAINTEYVLLFLEDFWLDKRVDNDFFLKTIDWMDRYKDIANFSFYPCLPGHNIQDGTFERFELRPQKCKYKFNCQVGLWRTKELKSYFRKHESPWEWEIYGSIRAGRIKKRFYVLKEDADRVFSYGNNLRGCIIHRGKWNKEEVVPLAEKYGLKINYSIRGFEDYDEYFRRLSIYEKIKLGHFWKRFKGRIHNLQRRWLSTRHISSERLEDRK